MCHALHLPACHTGTSTMTGNGWSTFSCSLQPRPPLQLMVFIEYMYVNRSTPLEARDASSICNLALTCMDLKLLCCFFCSLASLPRLVFAHISYSFFSAYHFRETELFGHQAKLESSTYTNHFAHSKKTRRINY